MRGERTWRWPVVAVAVTVAGIVAMGVAIWWGPGARPFEADQVLPGSTTVVALTSGRHELDWVGLAHRAQPGLSQLVLTATTADGHRASVRELTVGSCTDGGQGGRLTRCSIGALDVDEPGDYSIKVVSTTDDPSFGSLLVGRPSPPGPVGPAALAFLGLAMTISGLAGLVVYVWRQVPPVRWNWSWR